MTDEPLTDRLFTLIKTTALVAFTKEEADREAYLEANKAEYFAYAQQTQGVSPEQAQDWAEQMDEWVRAMLEIIVLNGGDPDASG